VLDANTGVAGVLGVRTARVWCVAGVEADVDLLEAFVALRFGGGGVGTLIPAG